MAEVIIGVAVVWLLLGIMAGIVIGRMMFKEGNRR